MPYEANTGLNVFNHYGPRRTGGAVGGNRTQDAVKQLKIRFTGESVNSPFTPKVAVPEGARFLRYILRVDEAFALTGTNPTVIFGGAVPATNGVVLTKAELEAVGTKAPTSAGTGTWATNSATGATASEFVTKAIGGTGGPTVSSLVGKATLIAEYVDNKSA
jgi:hypothetical protein